MIFDVNIANVNYITKYAALDLCGDETTYAHEGYDEAQSGLVRLIMGKPGVTCGGQIVVVNDVGRIYPRAYIHCHKCYPKETVGQGPNEVKRIVTKLSKEVRTADNSVPQGLFRELPHIAWDNFFSGKEVAIWCANQGFGMTTTLRRDRFPKEVPKEFFHGKKTTPKDQRAKVAKFLPPIVAIKKIDNGVLQLTSFQSTSCCNILSVNAYNQCGHYAHAKERGSLRHGTKQSWAIEMNDARKLYLATYRAIDTIDHLIKNCSMKYQSWKYWHSAMLLAKPMAIVIAFDMYKEAAKGNLDPAWKVKKPVSFFCNSRGTGTIDASVQAIRPKVPRRL
jgi:hypothetical protein